MEGQAEAGPAPGAVRDRDRAAVPPPDPFPPGGNARAPGRGHKESPIVLLLGHEGTVNALAVSPDERWIASASGDALNVWPMPDVMKPPLHTLPHAELMAKLDALTNLRVVRDPASATGWKLDIGPFPGWKDVPTW